MARVALKEGMISGMMKSKWSICLLSRNLHKWIRAKARVEVKPRLVSFLLLLFRLWIWGRNLVMSK